MTRPQLVLDDFLNIKADLWPDETFYGRQVETIDSVCWNAETYLVAGNKLGKDYITGFICVSAFLACWYKGIQCRIVATSVNAEHMRVLWGEIGRFMTTARRPIDAARGGPLILLSQEIRLAGENVETGKNPQSYVKGMVASKSNGMDALAGHHAGGGWTLGVGDESSGLDDLVYDKFQGWAKRMLFFGNPNPCNNWYRRNVKAGDLVAK